MNHLGPQSRWLLYKRRANRFPPHLLSQELAFSGIPKPNRPETLKEEHLSSVYFFSAALLYEKKNATRPEVAALHADFQRKQSQIRIFCRHRCVKDRLS